MNRNNNYVLFDRNERVKDQCYNIPGGINHVFAFQIPKRRLSVLTVSALQLDPPVQISSLHLWFSKTPLDDILFTSVSSLNPMLITLREKTIELCDWRMTNMRLGPLMLNPTLVYYINIRNMQAAQNAYKLILPS
jgi:hypothetical protein